MNTSSFFTRVKREVEVYFTSPLSYILLMSFLFGIGHITFEPDYGSFFLTRRADLNSFFKYIPWIFLFFVPAVNMCLWKEEYKLEGPNRGVQVVLPKFLAAWIFVSTALLCTFTMVITVVYLGEPDLGVVFLSYWAAWILAGSFLAIGCFFSTLVSQRAVRFVLTVTVCYLLLIIGSSPFRDFLNAFFPSYIVNFFGVFGLLEHFESIQSGVLSLGDIWFFGLMIGGWLMASIILLDKKVKD